jgi:hypothetical protein
MTKLVMNETLPINRGKWELSPQSLIGSVAIVFALCFRDDL